MSSNIYLYVPCNGTKYYTNSSVSSSSFVIKGDTQLDSHSYNNRIYTTFNNRALIITNNSSNGLSWDYTLEWWQRNAVWDNKAHCSTLLSSGDDSNKLQVHNPSSFGSIDLLKFENVFNISGGFDLKDDNITIDNNKWTHIAYVLNMTNGKAYFFINGTPIKSTTFSGQSSTNMYMICVGAKSSDINYVSEYFGGDLSDVILTNGVKYQENTSFTPSTKSPDITDLIAYGEESYIPEKYYISNQGRSNTNLVKINNKYYSFFSDVTEYIEDYTISEDLILNAPLDLPNKHIIINSGVNVTVQEPMMPLIINCNSLTNNGTITVNGKGWQTSRNGYEDANYSIIKGYVKGGYNYGHTTFAQYTSAQQIGGGAPDDTKDFARRTMLGLQNATPGLFRGCDGVGVCGPGYAGTLGGGGGAGCDGNAGNGGGSGSGGGGGASGGGSYNGPTGGDGSQADEVTNTSLFKQNKFSEIPMFGGAGGTVYLKHVGLNLSYTDGGGNIQIYARNIINNGTISANAVTTNNNPNNTRNSGNGGGGGGCIMLRYNLYENNGTVEALGESGLINYDGYYGGHGGNGLILLHNTMLYSMPRKYTVYFSNFSGTVEISENNTYSKTITNSGSIQVYVGSFISYTYNGVTNYTYILQDNTTITP